MKKIIKIKVEMEERWLNHFLSMLIHMERLGNIGSSRWIGIFSDGDGDFRPKFTIKDKFEKVEPKVNDDNKITYDAG